MEDAAKNKLIIINDEIKKNGVLSMETSRIEFIINFI
jgi:hypothetical protein